MAMFAISFINQTNAACCEPAFGLKHVCLGKSGEKVLSINALDNSQYWIRQSGKLDIYAEKCETRFCADGTVPAFYCGLGKCDLKGCNCSGGCIKGNGKSQESITKDWLSKHGLAKQAKHKF